MNGAGHDDYCNIRRSREGLTVKELEETHRYVVYFARQYLTCHVTGYVSSAHCKVGQSTLFNALQRGRNQAGGDFRILAELCFKDAKSAKKAEEYAHKLFMNRNVKGPQNQTELFDIPDNLVKKCVEELRDYCTVDNSKPLALVETMLFYPNQHFVVI